MREIRYRPIGMVHSPFKKPEGTPIQPSAASQDEGRVEVFPEYAAGLKDLDGFSHIILGDFVNLTILTCMTSTCQKKRPWK